MIPAQNISKTAFWLGIALPCVALAMTLLVTHSINGEFNAAFSSVTHTYKVLNLLEDAQAHIADAETGQRGFFLTGTEDYFRLRGTAIAAIDNDIEQLKILVHGNRQQEDNLGRLQRLVNDRLSAVSAHKELAPEKLAVVLTDEGRETVRQFRGLLYQMRQQETLVLAQRQQYAEEQFMFDQTVSLALVGVTVVALIAVMAIVIRFERLRQIVTVCAWTGQVKEGEEWINMEEYMKRHFGVSISHGVSREAAEKIVREARQAAKARQ